VLVVIAHPDDESFLAAGTIHAIRRSGGTVDVVCATAGERGSSHLKTPLTVRQLTAVRRSELKAVERVLGVHGLHQWAYPDCRLQDLVGVFTRRLVALAGRLRPAAVMSFGPDGFTGHHDHVATARAALAVARRLRVPLFRFAVPPRTLRHHPGWLVQRRSYGRYLPRIRPARATLRIPIDGRVKLRCLRLHRSQLESDDPFAQYPPAIARDMLAAEYFTIVRPRRAAVLHSPRAR
jgi:LmbE family N-acetylglucosaminyl deacetylase